MTAPIVPTTPNQADYAVVHTDIVALLDARAMLPHAASMR
jgi:hypothetical protein